MKQKGLDQYLHLTQQHMMKQFWINTFISPTRCYCKRFKILISTKPTILKLENSRKNVSNSTFVYTEHAKFQKAGFNSNWDVKQWNKMFWIDTFTSPSTFLCYNFSFGSIPSPHQVHSIAFLLQHLLGEVKVLIQNFLFHRVLHVGEVKI